jgi:organic hydroperoxide reductase OsmC/OhrA
MTEKTHTYTLAITWTGNTGQGTTSYRAYSRDHVYSAPGKPDIPGSSDPAFRGDAKRYNPEDLLVASLSSCHMLWYLHLCADAGVNVVAYRDDPVGTMVEDAVRGSDPAKARELHHSAYAKCYVANSVNFPVACEPEISVRE